MPTTKEDIREWLAKAREEGASHVIVVCDTFSYEDYPVYVKKDQDVLKIYKEYTEKSMQRVVEVYSMSLNIEKQLEELRAFHFDTKPRLWIVK